MAGDRSNNQDDALSMIFMRNQFYKEKYFLGLSVVLLGLIIIALLGGMLNYLINNPSQPLYFVTDSAGRFVQDLPGQTPNMSSADVAVWTTTAVEAAYSYDFMNYRGQLQDAQKYFTEYGWRNYKASLQASNNLNALQVRKMVVVAKVIGVPKLVAEGPLGKTGTYAYKFDMPLLVTYNLPPYNGTKKFENALIVTVIVQRQNILSSYKGLGIVQMVATAPQASGATSDTMTAN
jgi:intracellular multiplication protein IcmL